MRFAWIALAAGGAALIVLLIMAGTRLQVSIKPTTASTDASVPAPPAEIAAEPARPVQVRPVEPALVAPPALAPDLQRIEPRASLGDLALARPSEPEETLLYRPVATAAGSLKAGGHSIVLDGIVPTEPKEECRSADGSSWPCGMIARTAFRNWLRGRAVECVVGEPPANEPVTSPCMLAGEDIALWLVENGFATAEPGGPYVEAGKEAEAAGRGIFGPAPGG